MICACCIFQPTGSFVQPAASDDPFGLLSHWLQEGHDNDRSGEEGDSDRSRTEVYSRSC